MALLAVTPVAPSGQSDVPFLDDTVETRINLTQPPDRDNELIAVAALHGPPGILAVLRTRKEYGWFVILALRAVEVCLSPRQEHEAIPVLRECDPVQFNIQMYELEMIDEILQLMHHYEHLKAVQRAGLAIVEVLVMEDTNWRDEVTRKGGVALICDIARKWEDSPLLLGQIMTCMSYLAAEDYIEVMLCQHDALEFVVRAMRKFTGNADLMTRASLALLNLTVCEPHVEELMDKEAILFVLHVIDAHPMDVHLTIILCGVIANLSVLVEVRDLLVNSGVLERMQRAMKLDPGNAVLQVASLKALVNYSTSTEHYLKMEELELPALVAQTMVAHTHDPGVQKYGNYFMGQSTSCPIS